MTTSVVQTRIDPTNEIVQHGVVPYPAWPKKIASAVNLDGAQVEIVTLTLTAFAANEDIVFVFNGETIRHKMLAADADINGALAAFVAAMKLDGRIGRLAKIEGAGAVATFTGKFKGQSLGISENDARLTYAQTQAPADAAATEFGAPLLRTGQGTARDRRQTAKPMGALTTARSQQVVYGTGTVIVAVRLRGVTERVSGGTAAALATALDGLEGVDAANAAGTITVSASTPGEWFEILHISGDATLGALVEGDRMDKELLGIACYTELSTSGSYDAKRAPDVLLGGPQWHKIAGATIGQHLFFGTASDDERVKLHATSGTGRVYSERIVVDDIQGDFVLIDLAPLSSLR